MRGRRDTAPPRRPPSVAGRPVSPRGGDVGQLLRASPRCTPSLATRRLTREDHRATPGGAGRGCSEARMTHVIATELRPSERAPHETRAIGRPGDDLGDRSRTRRGRRPGALEASCGSVSPRPWSPRAAGRSRPDSTPAPRSPRQPRTARSAGATGAWAGPVTWGCAPASATWSSLRDAGRAAGRAPTPRATGYPYREDQRRRGQVARPAAEERPGGGASPGGASRVRSPPSSRKNGGPPPRWQAAN